MPHDQRPTAIVTGASRGIGLGIAHALAQSGFNLLVTGTRRNESTATVLEDIRNHGVNAEFFAGDISDLGSHDELVSSAQTAFGRIDCLVNNAGIASPVRGDLLELSPENFDKVIGTNLRGTVFLSQKVSKAMLAQTDEIPKSIVNITSVSAEMVSPERADYCMSKAGLAMWTKALALRLATSGVGVFEVRPGIIKTDMTSGVTSKYDTLIADGLVPVKRWGESIDIGNIVASLASGKFSFATGSVINADGGLSIQKL